MDNTKKFNDKANEYSSGRSSYPKALIDTLYDMYGFDKSSVIADIGSGTGILTRQLLEMGSEVYAVEPNENMRKKAETELASINNNFYSVNATAENTTLLDRSIDHITVAQAFHWFNAALFKKECNRILRERGNVVLIWNTRDIDAEINKMQSRVFEKYCRDFNGFSGAMKRDDDRIKLFFDVLGYDVLEFKNPISYDRDRYISRCLSSSYSLMEWDKGFDKYLIELNAIFDKFSENGVLTIPNNTVAYIGKIN